MLFGTLSFGLAVVLGQGAPKRTVDGHVTLREEDGTRIDDASGRLVLRAFARLPAADAKAAPRSDPARKLDRIVVDVRSGAFEFTSPRDAVFTVDRAELSGRPAHIVSPSREIIPPESGVWQIEADRSLLKRLHVGAKGGANESDAELGGVTLAFADPNDRGDDPGYVSDDQFLLRDVKSPIELAGPPPDREGRSRERFWIRAPDRAWQLVTIDFGDDRDVHVELEPATTLVVELRGAAPPAGAVVRLRQRLNFFPLSFVRGLSGGSKEESDELEESFHVADLEIDGRARYVFEALEPRDYVATVEVGPWFDAPLQIARAIVTLPRGKRTTLELEVRPPPTAPHRVPFCGMLTFDTAWGLDPPDLRIWPAPAMRGPAPRSSVRVRGDQMARVDAATGRFAFDFGEVDPGHYNLRIEGFGLLDDVVVPDGGKTDYALTLGPPCAFLVDFVDATSHAPAAMEELKFGVTSGEGDYSFDDRSARRGLKPGQFLITAPPGWIRLECTKRPYSQVEAWWEMTPGVSHESLEVEQSCGVTVAFRLDGAGYVPESASIDLRAIGPFRLPRTTSSRYDEKVFWADASEPGPYQLEIGPGSAFEAIPTQGVDLVRGEFKVITVDLKRGR